jgi:hypothetical protein
MATAYRQPHPKIKSGNWLGGTNMEDPADILFTE